MYGVDSFDAILPPGTAAIMAVGGSKPTVVATPDGLLGVRKVMQVGGGGGAFFWLGTTGLEFDRGSGV
jgi:hypothetical protein